MKKLLVALLMLASLGASADVIVDRYQPGMSVGCEPAKIPAHWEMIGGTRYWVPETDSGVVTLRACYTPSAYWKERWTDDPDKGGVFIERLQ